MPLSIDRYLKNDTSPSSSNLFYYLSVIYLFLFIYVYEKNFYFFLMIKEKVPTKKAKVQVLESPVPDNVMIPFLIFIIINLIKYIICISRKKMMHLPS